MKKFGTKTRNTIAITLILTFAFMFVPIQHMTYAEEDLPVSYTHLDVYKRQI